MRRGRKVNVSGLVDPRDGSGEAKRRAKLFLKNIRGELTVREMAEALGVNEAMAYRLRDQAIESLVAGFEPKPVGRPARERPPERVEELEGRVKDLERDLLVSRVREEIEDMGLKKKHRSEGDDGERR